MQTFLPYESFEESAYNLDPKRLGKQRVETLQIMKALLKDEGWVNHPATLMWKGHEGALYLYQKACCNEWVENLGFEDTCLHKTARMLFDEYTGEVNFDNPPWLGRVDFHLSHQSNLLRKDPDYYAKLFPGVPNDLPYIWPSKEAS